VKTSCWIAAALVLGCLAVSASWAKAEPVQARVTGVKLVVTDPARNSEVGSVQLTLADGKVVQLTKGLSCYPKVEEEGHLIGWLSGEYGRSSRYPDRFYATELHLYQSGREVVKMSGVLPFIDGWGFWDSGTRVVLRSRNGHGPSWIELHDAKTGKLLDKVKGYEKIDKLPPWARKFTDL